jgi:dGTPase
MARLNDQKAINTTVIIHNMIIDLCENSSTENGLCLSSPLRKQINEIKAFNNEYIYHHKKLNTFKKYSELVINELFNALLSIYDGENTLKCLDKRRAKKSILISDFGDWIVRYCDFDFTAFEWAYNISKMCDNEKIYGHLETKEKYVQAIIDYIAGMTDSYAIKVFNELLAY